MTTHRLKLARRFLADVVSGRKKAEVRQDDRDYEVGDYINFHCPHTDYRYRSAPTYVITHILEGGQFGIEEGWAVLSIEPVMGDCE